MQHVRQRPSYITRLVTREYAPGPGRELIPVKSYAGFYVTGLGTPHAQQAPACDDNDQRRREQPATPTSGATTK